MPQYLSTDPNAGEPIAEEDGYLSTDPNAGEPAEEAGAEKPGMFSLKNIKDAAYKASPLPLFERQNLPTTLAGIGMGVGGPGGAAVGGATGTALRDIIGAATGAEDVPTTPAGAFGNVAGNAAVQGGMSMLPAALQGGAKRLYGGLLKPAKELRKSFGGTGAIVEPLLEKGIPITRGGEERIGQAVSASRGKAMEMVRGAEGTVPNVTAREIVGEFKPVVETLRKRADIGQTSELPKVGERGRSIVQSTSRGTGMQPTRAQALKEEAQDAASGAYRMRERGGAKQLSADDLLDEATAKGFQKSIETRVPGVGPQNRETQRLLGPLRAVEDALAREGNNLALGGVRDLTAFGVGALGGGVPGGAFTAAVVRALATPSAGSMAAIAAYQAGRLPLDQVLRVLTIEGQKAMETP